MAPVARRSHTAWGRPIEPQLVLGPQRPGKPVQGAAIHIQGLEKSFDGVPVLRGIDLDVPAGQFVAIVGKSGCGKSTFLRMVSGLDKPSAGFIHLGGIPRHERAISRIVFQEPRLLPWANVADNVAVGLGPDVPRAVARQKALEALGDVQLSERAAEWPSRLSGGQRQRVALARALVGDPDFLALDEPLGALDALTRITMQSLVERIWTAQGFTALFVTHDVSEAVALADRVIVLDEGRVALDMAVPAPRPRGRGSREAAELEARLLSAILDAH